MPLHILVMRAAWPAFLAACVLELVVFALVDPQDLHWSGQALELSRQAVYTLSFFGFWLITTGACLMTAALGWPENEDGTDSAQRTQE